MIKHSVKALFAFAAIMTLAACTGFGLIDEETACDNRIAPGVELTGPVSEPRFLKTLINGNLADYILKDANRLDEAVTAMDGHGANLGARIRSADNSAFANGLAGVSARLFLDAAKLTLNQNDNFGQEIRVDTTGQIEAYFYDDATGSGCLRVLMVTTAKRADGKQRSLAYRWTVFVDTIAGKKGFNAAPKVPTTDPTYNANDVFLTGPGTAADTVAISAAMAAGFEYKLWAKGASIRVTRVERKIGNGSFKLLRSNHPFYRTTAESCIDMMFASYPPQTIPPGEGPPYYCLGRCKNPYIVNTK